MSIKKTEKWVYYICAKCGIKKYIPIKKYNNEEEITCGKCKKNTKNDDNEKNINETTNNDFNDENGEKFYAK